jgi:polar amino acid transport system substrate-binding protein
MRNSITLFLAGLLCLPAMAQSPASTLAPTGTLRAAFLGTNPVHARMDPQTGAITGPVADLVKELAGELGVPYTLIPVPNAAGVIDHLKKRTVDIGFLAYDESRAQEVDFAGPFALMLSSFIVRADSPIQNTADADRSGLQIGVVRGQSQQIFLSANVKNAAVRIFETMPPQAELERLIVSGEIHAFGVNTQRAVDAAAASSRLRALTDSFLGVEQSFVVEKGNVTKAATINRFVDAVRASGFIKASLERANLAGVDVASPRK